MVERDGERARATGRAPWPRTATKVVAALAVGALLAFVIGVRVGRPSGPPSADAVDVQALQDLRYHAEQAVGLSLVLLDKPGNGASVALRRLAREIVTAMSSDSGRMGQVLMEFGAPVDADRDRALTWTGDAVPINEMPGLAVDEDTTLFEQAAGERADRLYARLMSAHHDGAIAIAGRAAELATRAEVRELLLDVVAHRQEELRQLRSLVPTG